MRAATRPDPVLETARSLQAAGNAEGAVTEYMRYLFFHPTGEKLSDVYFSLGKAYLDLNQWESAKDAWRQSVKLAANDSLKNARRISLAIQSLAHRNYSLAVLELLKVSSFGRQPQLRRKALFYLGVAELYLLEFDQAGTAFQAFFRGDSSQKGKETWAKVEALLQRGEAIRPKSQILARWLSTFLPGLGQLYAGDLKNALNALALNGVLGYGVGRAFLEKDYIDAILEGGFLFQRYYMGNRFRAAQIARTRPQKKQRQIAKQILEVLDSYLSGK